MRNNDDPFAGYRVLVTGGTGFLGSHLSAACQRRGAEVHVVSRSTPAGTADSIRFWRGDLSDVATARALFAATRPTHVFHLCSHGVGRPDLEQVLPTLHHDLATTVHVLLAATETGAQRVILASSFEEPLPSDATVAPSSPYAAAKWASSMYARMFHLLYRTPVVMLRTFMTYGPRQAEHKLLPHVILSLLRGEAARVSSGAREVDWIYVDDVVAGMLAAAETPRLEGETFDLGSGRLVPIKAVLTKITALVGAAVQPLFGALPDRPCERVRAADLGPVSSRLNWRPVTSLDDGLKKTVDWFRERARAA